MQDYGMNVIPNLNWCGEKTYQFAFDGLEKGGTFATSTISIKKDKESKKIFFDGMKEALKILQPSTMIIYGGDIGFDFGKTNVVYINNHNAERLKKC